jgi:uncharacterized protein with HEPN domain
MLDAARKIKKYTSRTTPEHFTKNEEKQSAVIMQLIIIGELTKKLPESYKSHIALPWKQIAGFRNRAVHEYFSLDIQDLWQTVTVDIPELDRAIQTFVKNLN